MSLKDRGADMLNRLAAKAAAITGGVYTRLSPNESPTASLADFVAGDSEQTSRAGPGEVATRLEFTERSIMGPVAALTQNGTAFLPAIGDTWTETIDGTACTFEVKPVAGLKEWDWCDTGRTRIRIRGKRV